MSRAMDLLCELEWAGPEGRCPSCHGDATHYVGCELAECLGRPVVFRETTDFDDAEIPFEDGAQAPATASRK